MRLFMFEQNQIKILLIRNWTW